MLWSLPPKQQGSPITQAVGAPVEEPAASVLTSLNISRPLLPAYGLEQPLEITLGVPTSRGLLCAQHCATLLAVTSLLSHSPDT